MRALSDEFCTKPRCLGVFRGAVDFLGLLVRGRHQLAAGLLCRFFDPLEGGGAQGLGLAELEGFGLVQGRGDGLFDILDHDGSVFLDARLAAGHVHVFVFDDVGVAGAFAIDFLGVLNRAFDDDLDADLLDGEFDRLVDRVGFLVPVDHDRGAGAGRVGDRDADLAAVGPFLDGFQRGEFDRDRTVEFHVDGKFGFVRHGGVSFGNDYSRLVRGELSPGW